VLDPYEEAKIVGMPTIQVLLEGFESSNFGAKGLGADFQVLLEGWFWNLV
jgi:hypothetical protein